MDYIHEYIKVVVKNGQVDREAIQMAYSRGLISYSTMAEKLKEMLRDEKAKIEAAA